MTRSEAATKIISLFPESSVCVQIDDWHHRSDNNRPRRNEQTYIISLVPGIGKDCTQFRGKSLAECVAQAEAAHAATEAARAAAEAARLDAEFARDDGQRPPIRQSNPTDPTDGEWTIDPTEDQVADGITNAVPTDAF